MSLMQRIRVANTSRTAELEIYPCGHEDFVQWQRQIQNPYITPYGGIGSNWNWPALFLGCQFSEQALGRQCVMFQLRVADPTGNAVPVAQAVLSLPYPFPANKREDCLFLWFVVATPERALKAFGIQDRFSVLPAILDVAVQCSIGHGLEGRIGLHADAKGSAAENDALSNKYQKYGLAQRKKSWTFFRFPHRPDDGRLFYFSPDAARSFANKQDDLR